MPESMTPLIILGVVGALFILLLSLLTNNYSLNNIKSKTVGDGQYGTARWATDQEIRKAYVTVPFDVASWRAGKKRPTVQGLVLGSVQRGKRLEALAHIRQTFPLICVVLRDDMRRIIDNDVLLVVCQVIECITTPAQQHRCSHHRCHHLDSCSSHRTPFLTQSIN